MIRSFRILNNPEYKKAFLANVKGKYEKGFEFCIFAREIQKKWEEQTQEFLSREGIRFVSHREVVQGIINNALKENYSNDSELQLIILMNRFWGSARTGIRAHENDISVFLHLLSRVFHAYSTG